MKPKWMKNRKRVSVVDSWEADSLDRLWALCPPGWVIKTDKEVIG